MTLTPAPFRPAAPDLTIAIGPTTLAVTEDGGTLMIGVDVAITNAGSIHLDDGWLSWPADAHIRDLTPVTPVGTWVALDGWWYGEGVDLAPDAANVPVTESADGDTNCTPLTITLPSD